METKKETKGTNVPRWRIALRWLVRVTAFWFAVEMFGWVALEGSLTSLLYAGVRNGYENARFSLVEAIARPKDPGPAPDAKVVTAANALGLRVFSELTRETAGQNVFFSPSSVATGLTMAYNGAAGHTQATMAQALGLNGISLADVNTAYERIQAHLTATHPRIQVTNAHGVWVDDQARLVPDFVRHMEESFGAKAETLDLQSSGAPDKINGWIKAKTNGRIDRVVDKLGRDERVILADALTFHGTWMHQFKKSATRPAPFYLLDGSEKTLPMMSQKATVGFFIDRDFAAARLPYGNGSMAMYLFIPDENDGLSAFLESFTPERWEAWMSQFHEEEIHISLPRFRVECTGNLHEPLAALGLREAFDGGRADLSAMAAPDAGLYLGQVLQRARLEVDEAGTRAEAVTVHLMVFAGGPPSVRADRPFFCAIRDERTGLILFAGAIYDPEAIGH